MTEELNAVADISFLQLLFLVSLLLPMILISRYFELKIIRKTIISVIRMFLQLASVGFYLNYLFQYNKTWLNLLYFFLMVFIATYSISGSIRLKFSKSILIIFLPIFLPTFLIVTIFSSAILKLTPVYDAQYLVPISGMILGNSMASIIIALNMFFELFKQREKEYLYALALGATKIEALKPYIGKALTAIIAPTLAQMATLGIVSLPGMMTGQILGGSAPMVAIKYQIGIMIMIFATKIFTILLSLYLATKLTFDDYMLPKKEIFTKR